MFRANFQSLLPRVSQMIMRRRAPLALALLLIGVALTAALLLSWEQKTAAQSKKKLEPCATDSGGKVTLKPGCEWRRISNSKVQAVEKGAGGATPRRYGIVEVSCTCTKQGPADSGFKSVECPYDIAGDAVTCGKSPCNTACTKKYTLK